jgi:hypothetical protein
MARKRKNNPKKIRVKKQIGGAAALGAMNRVARENLKKLDEINLPPQPTAPSAPRQRQDIVAPGNS